MTQNRLSFISLFALLFLAFAGSASAVKPMDPTIGPIAHINPKTKSVLVAGKSPRCAYGSGVSVNVRVRQAGRSAIGSWRADCVGPRLTWQLDLRSDRGRFKAGTARVVAISTTRRNAKIVAKRRVSSRVRLKVGQGSPVGDYRVNAGVTVTAPQGITVWIRGGGSGSLGSNCTSDETVTSVTPSGGSERVVIGYNAKTGGSCAIEDSWSNFKVWLYGMGRSDSAHFFLGQHSGLLGSRDYEATCYSGTPHDVEISRLNDWFDSKRCEKVGDFELEITIEDR